MENGATIFLESSWALNVTDCKEAATTLCGTLAGAEVKSGMSYPVDDVLINFGKNGQLMEQHLSSLGKIAFFDGETNAPALLEATQWLEAIINDTEPLVKPEEAFVVTKILEAIYKSAELGTEVKF